MMLFVILVLIFTIPSVQISVGKYVAKRINDDFGTKIIINKIGLKLNGDVQLKNVYVEDYKKDTLININELNTSIVNFKNLYNGKLAFGDIEIINLMFHIKTYKGEVLNNLDYFIEKFEDENPSSDSHFLLSSGDVSIYNSVFVFTDENKETAKRLDLRNLNINATNFLINGSNVSARINTLSFKDSRGVTVRNLTTDFSYTVNDMTFADLTLKTPNSILKGDLKFLYKRENLAYFTDKVNIQATFTESSVLLDELNTFYNEFGKNQKAKFSAKISGTLNNLKVNKLQLNTSSKSKIYGNFNFKNLFSAQEGDFYMNANFSNLTSTYKDLKSLLPNVLGDVIPTDFKKLGVFKIVGNSQVTRSKVIADIKMDTELGFIDSNLEIDKIDDIDNAKYKGNVNFKDFDLGVIADNPDLGIASLDFDVIGSGFTIKNLDTQVKGEVFQIAYNNYNYKNIQVSGNLKNHIFDGILIANDPNLKLHFAGLIDYSEAINKYDFIAEIDHANLRALNFVKRDSVSIFESKVKININASDFDDASGVISFDKTSYTNEKKTYYFEQFNVASRFENDVRFIEVNSPDIVDGSLSGRFSFKDLGNLFKNALGSIYANYKPYEVKSNQSIDFNFKIYNKIVEVVFPDFKLANNTFIRGRVESDEEKFRLTFKSPGIKYSNNFANNIELQVDNSNPLFNTYIELDSLHTKEYSLSKLNLINVTVNDTLFIRSEFTGGKNNKDIYNLSLYHTIDKDNKSVLGFKKSNVTVKNYKWFINESNDKRNKITFDKDFNYFDIEGFVINHKNEEIKLSGFLNGKNQKDLKLDFKDIALEKILPDMEGALFSGLLNGNLNVLQKNGNYLPNSTIVIDDFKINDFALGSFDAKIKGNETLTHYYVDVNIKDDETRSFLARGDINFANNKTNLNVNVDFNKFDLSPLNPLLEGVLSNIRGKATGQVNLAGDFKNLDINGELNLNKAGLGIPYLNVDYQFNENALVTLKKQSFLFNKIKLTDTKYKSKGELSGALNHVNFSDWSLDLNVNTPRIVVLDTKEDENTPYYGTGFVGGTAHIYGPANELVIDVTAETKEGTVFKIPLNDSDSFGDNSYVHFVTKEEKEARINGSGIVTENVKGIELNFDLTVNEDAEVEIIIDKKTGHALKGRGRGALLIEIVTTGKFNMWGDFSVFEGRYNFAYGGLVQKEFIVEPGGTIAWEGDPLNAIIRMNAVYKTQANPSPLLDNPISRSIPVELNIALSGNLEQFDPKFSFNFPNVNSALKSELQYRLDSSVDAQNQALYLVSTGSFSRGLGDLNFSGTIAERLNGIVNGLFSNSDGKLNVGVNYEAGENRPDYQSNDRVGLTLQTQITDRVLLNGKVGVPVGASTAATETVVAGDVEINFLLNEDGTLTANVFNRENSIRNFGQAIGYTQGLGISYNVDFDTFKELINSIFNNQKKQARKEEESESIKEEKKGLPNFIKEKNTTNK